MGKETYKLNNLFNKLGIKTSLKTTNTISKLLKQNIDKTDQIEQSGIYTLTCQSGDLYIGQTGRKIKDRYKEHITSFINDEKSNYATHLIENNHEPQNIQTSMKLLHNIQKGQKKNILENLEIYKHNTLNTKKLINIQINNKSQPSFTPFQTLYNLKRKRTENKNDGPEQNKTKT